MPELPEVERFRQFFERHALGRLIERVTIHDQRILGETSASALRAQLKRKTFSRTHRHGKHLFAQFSESRWLRIHFGMTGDLYFNALSAEFDQNEPRFARVSFHTADGDVLVYDDARLFGRVELVNSPEDYVREKGLGPDPLARGFTLRLFRKLLEGRKGAIKSLLLSQEILAGVGNLYADETLFQTSIRPSRSVAQLKEGEIEAIFTALRKILRETIRRKLLNLPYPKHYLIPSRERDAVCPACGGEIRQSVVFGRTTYFCARHQR